jgi:uncharacterized protein (TIGR03790 family)
MRLLLPLLFAASCLAQSSRPLNQRVLILANDRAPESLGVARYYAERRQIPLTNILRLKTNPGETLSLDEYKEQIENPLRKFLDANNGAMRHQILYIVPVYGIPLKVPDKLGVDSMISFMYAGHDEQKPPLRNPYSGPTGSRPPKFAEWSDGPAAAANFKMFVVTRLDGPTAAIARGLVDKAIEGEKTVTRKTGVAYFDYQGWRKPDEWQFGVDDEIRTGAEQAKALGFETVLHTQAKTACHAKIAPATQYLWDDAKKQMILSTHLSSGGVNLPLPGLAEADFTARLESLDRVMQTSVTLRFGTASEKTYVRFYYPFVPFSEYNATGEAILEKVVDGTVAARAVFKMTNNEKEVNNAGELELSVRARKIAAYRNGVELFSAEDKSGRPLTLTSAGIFAVCWTAALRGFRVQDAAGKPVWDDTFQTDTSARYQWQITPAGGRNAMWLWGWYAGAPDAYRFLPGAVGAELTSFTAATIRTPLNSDPKRAGFREARWGGNWVPRLLEEGITATWGAVAEPYANFYARGPNIFDHLWAGYNFGDSFYIAQNALRWVMVAVGDPLYSPKFP